MVKQLAILTLAVIAAAAVGCGAPEADTASAPPRAPVGIAYANVAELSVHKEPADASEVVATMSQGEPLTIMSEKGEWVEVRLDFERNGWAKKSDTADELVQQDVSAGSGGVRFKVPPNPVPSQGGATGEIVLIANVNEFGRVMSIRTQSNSTGSTYLEAKNTAELQKAEFYPLTQGGKTVPFEYEYTVSY